MAKAPQLIIHTSQVDEYDNDYRYYGTYLHGNLEDDMEYDIFSFEEKQHFNAGMHYMYINGLHCTFFLWGGGNVNDCMNNKKEWGGLLVYTDDHSAYRYAAKEYKEESENLQSSRFE